MSAVTILLVDDDDTIRNNLGSFLERSGFQVVTAAAGDEALRWLSQHAVDIVILDVMLPGMNGRAVLRQLRQRSNWLPVIMLTHVGEAAERAMTIEEGADDYINKPFDAHELVARIRGVLRRVQIGQPPLTAVNRLISGDLVLDRSSRRVMLNQQEQTLTPKAVTLLEYLMTHPDELISRERLLDAVWGWDYPAGTRAVDTRIAELRKTLRDTANQPRYIETIPSQGYRFIGTVERGG